MSFEENKNNQSSDLETRDVSSENVAENVGSTIENLDTPETSEPVSDDAAASSDKPKSFSFDSFKGFERKKSKREIAEMKAAEKEAEAAAQKTPGIGSDIENIDPVPDEKAPDDKAPEETESKPKRKRLFGLPKRDKKAEEQETEQSESQTENGTEALTPGEAAASAAAAVAATGLAAEAADDISDDNTINASQEKTDVKDKNNKPKRFGLKKKKDKEDWF